MRVSWASDKKSYFCFSREATSSVSFACPSEYDNYRAGSLARVQDLPVVHEQVWQPDVLGRDPHVHHVPVLGRVPLEVGVIPLLQHDRPDKEDEWSQAKLLILLPDFVFKGQGSKTTTEFLMDPWGPLRGGRKGDIG